MASTARPPADDAEQVGRRVEALTRVVLRPIGNPLPLGFAALGAGSVLASGLQLGWLAPTAGHQVGLAILVFVVPAQLLAAVFGFLARDSVGGTGMGILAGSWLATSVLQLTAAPETTIPTLGLVLFFASAALMGPVLGALTGKVVAGLVMAMAAVRFALTGVYEYDGGHGWQHASGWFGVAVTVVALYGSIAFELEDTRRATVLPVLRHGVGRKALTGGMLDEIRQLNHEAGVREQL